MISIFSFSEDIESEIYFYRRFSYHNIPFFTAP
ncbi:unknown [Bacteroides sp. CAG:709]|nr:unknown [Bacteroides sp. CAG:709]